MPTLRLVLLTVLFALLSPMAHAQTAHTVFLLIGQSNASGRATATADFPPDDPNDARVLYRYDTDTTSAFTDLHTSGDSFVPLAPAPNRRFGPEIGLGRAIATAALPSPVIIKFARGGTNLHTDWRPDATKGRQSYAAWLAHLRAALADLEARGDTYTLAGLFWMQGESDSDPDHAAAYAANLEAFIARVRLDLEVPELPFIIGRVGPRAATPSRDTVRAAQVAIGERTPRAAWVDTDDLARFDGVHYDAPANLTLGQRFAAAWQSLAARP
jgi:hypothetical protein